MRRLLLAFLVAVLPVLARAEGGLRDLMPPGAYGDRLFAMFDAGPDAVDLAGLRAVYAADAAFDGRSRLAERDAERMLAEAEGRPAPVWTEEDVLRAIFADFPLLETQMAAFDHFGTSDAPNAPALREHHAAFFRQIIESILATERQGEGGPVYSVLSVGEEYAVLTHLGRKAGTQALVMIAGVPHDRIETAEGPVYFDISAFYGK